MEIEVIRIEHIPTPAPLQKLLDSRSTTLTDVLNQPLVFRLFRTGNDQIIMFFVKHIKELLALTFNTKEIDLSAKAFAILEHSQPLLTQAMLRKQRLHSAAMEIMATDNAPALLLSRISSLTLAALLVDPQTVTVECGYIFQLLSFLNEPSVLSMFETMCSNDSDMIMIQNWLLSVGFTKVLEKEIDSFKLPDNATYKSHEAGQLCGLYRILTICAESPILGPKITTQSFVSTLNRDIGCYPPFVEDSRWEALSAIYCDDTFVSMRGLLQQAIEVINDPQTCQRRAAIHAVEILKGMLILDQVIGPFLMEAGIPKLCIEKILEHPDHTFLHLALTGFFEAAMTQLNTREKTLTDAFPSVMANIRNSNKNVRSSMIRMLEVVVEIGNADAEAFALMKQVDGFLSFVRNELAHRNVILTSPYGGMMPLVNQKDDANFLAERTLQSMRTW